MVVWKALSCRVNQRCSPLLSECLTSQGATSISVVSLENTTDVIVEALFTDDTDCTLVQKNLAWIETEDLPLEWSERAILNCDWVRECQKDFSPVLINDRLWVCSAASQVERLPHHKIIRLDPGSAFGTGGHETTRLCLQWLCQASLDHSVVIDYGCGTGVLSLAALACGAQFCVGVDNDPNAMVAARYNVNLNQSLCEQRVRFIHSDDFSPLAADVVVANMLAPPLRELIDTFVACLSPGGWCVLSGLMEQNLSEIRALYASYFTEQACWVEGEWYCLIYKKNV